jgi:hypothetical protein
MGRCGRRGASADRDPTDPRDAAELVKRHELWVGEDEPRSNDHGAPEATYDYVDEVGTPLFQVRRWPGKRFSQHRADGRGGWGLKLGDARRVLYRLPQVIDAVARGERIYVVEGERDVHALERAGAVATCNPGGAGKWRAQYADALHGADVVVIADDDEPGHKHACEVAGALAGHAARVGVVRAAVGKDAADHLAAGRSLEELVPLATEDGDTALVHTGFVPSDLGRSLTSCPGPTSR